MQPKFRGLPMSGFVSTFMVVFREGLEALLIVGIAAAYLRRTGRAALLPATYWGVGAAVAASAAIGLLLASLGELGAAWEGALALAAAVLVIGCTVHLLSVGRAMKQRIAAALDNAAGEGGAHGAWAALGVGAFVFLMVTREGVEAATMIAATAGQRGGWAMALGGVLGFAAAGAVATAWSVFGRRVNLGIFFRFAAVFLVLFSAQLLVYAFHEFVEAELVPFVDNEYWHVVTEPYGPEGEFGEWLTYALVGVPSAWLLWLWARDRLRRAVPTGANA